MLSVRRISVFTTADPCSTSVSIAASGASGPDWHEDSVSISDFQPTGRPCAETQHEESSMPKKIVDTILPTTMVGSYPRPHWYHQQLLGRDVRVAFKEVAARGGLPRRDAGRDPRPGGGRPRHRHRRPDVVRRLRRRDRLVLLVHVRAHRRLRAGPRAASVDRAQETRDNTIDAAPHRLGRRDQQRPGHARPDPARRPLQDREAVHGQADQGLGRRRARSTSPGTSTSSTTRTRRSSATRSRRSSTRR